MHVAGISPIYVSVNCHFLLLILIEGPVWVHIAHIQFHSSESNFFGKLYLNKPNDTFVTCRLTFFY